MQGGAQDNWRNNGINAHVQKAQQTVSRDKSSLKRKDTTCKETHREKWLWFPEGEKTAFQKTRECLLKAESNSQPRILYPAKIPFKNEGDDCIVKVNLTVYTLYFNKADFLKGNIKTSL